MIRLGKLTDYAIVVLSQMAYQQEKASASCLAARTGIPEPTVAKLLKALARGGVITSTRGAHGGYMLDRTAKDITVTEIVEALEGPIALTACVETSNDDCSVESLCPMRGGWDKVNHAIRGALDDVTLADMTEVRL